MRWGTKPLEPTRFDGTTPDRQVRVTLADGGILVVRNPFISGDSLVWLRPAADEPAAGDAPPREQRQGIPLAQIRSVQVREVDAAKTTLLVVGTVGLVALLVAAASYDPWGSGHSGGSSGTGGSCDYCSSCPLVYSWDGHRWRLDSGTFGGAIMHAHARTDVDNLDFVQPDHGVMRLKLANEQRETDYVDALSVLAVDHDSGLTVAPDAAGGLHTIGALTSPVAARDFRGRDALAQVRAADGWNWESSPGGRAAMTVADLRDGLELAFPRRGGAGTARLVVDGNVTAWAALMMERFVAAHGRATQAWYDSLDRDTQGARRLGEALARQAFLSAAVLVDGRWQPQGLIWDAGRQGANLPASHARVVPNPRAGSGRAGRGAPQCVAERSAGDLQGRRGKDERGARRDGGRGPMSGRVVWVTGLGAVTGAGVGAAPLLDALRAGRSCVRPLPELDGLPAAPAPDPPRDRRGPRLEGTGVRHRRGVPEDRRRPRGLGGGGRRRVSAAARRDRPLPTGWDPRHAEPRRGGVLTVRSAPDGHRAGRGCGGAGARGREARGAAGGTAARRDNGLRAHVRSLLDGQPGAGRRGGDGVGARRARGALAGLDRLDQDARHGYQAQRRRRGTGHRQGVRDGADRRAAHVAEAGARTLAWGERRGGSGGWPARAGKRVRAADPRHRVRRPGAAAVPHRAQRRAVERP